MSAAATLMWFLTLVFDTFGQLALKAAAGADGDGLAHWKAMAKDKWIYFGVSAYVIEFFVWLAFLFYGAALSGSISWQCKYLDCNNWWSHLLQRSTYTQANSGINHGGSRRGSGWLGKLK